MNSKNQMTPEQRARFENFVNFLVSVAVGLAVGAIFAGVIYLILN